MVMAFTIIKVNGPERRADIHAINGKFPKDFLKLTDAHIDEGDWWLAYADGDDDIAGFAGVVPFHPFSDYGYLKRTEIGRAHV